MNLPATPVFYVFKIGCICSATGIRVSGMRSDSIFLS